MESYVNKEAFARRKARLEAKETEEPTSKAKEDDGVTHISGEELFNSPEMQLFHMLFGGR